MTESKYLKEVYRAYENGIPVVGPTYIGTMLGVNKTTAYQALQKLVKMETREDGLRHVSQKQGFHPRGAGQGYGKKVDTPSSPSRMSYRGLPRIVPQGGMQGG
ncbi:MAG: hypothetical protein JRI56_13280 [Deltaproteobacteria bacterium]|nr:hypothetical protein [Deltaproteobacteria bacterium]